MYIGTATMESSMEVSQKIKIKIELLYDPAIPVLGIHPKDMKLGSQRDICTPVFVAALFTIAKIWKQPTFLSMDEWIKKMREREREIGDR